MAVDSIATGFGFATSNSIPSSHIWSNDNRESNIIDNQTKKMTEMEDTVKQLTQDEAELWNKLSRRKLELERVEKRLKGLENVKPEY